MIAEEAGIAHLQAVAAFVGGEGVDLGAGESARHEFDFSQGTITAATVGGDAGLVTVHRADHAEKIGVGCVWGCSTLHD